jgi:8-oxo-dGTP diphosphatase
MVSPRSPASNLGGASSVSVLVVIFTVIEDDLQALLINRSSDPYKGLWAIPGGLLRGDESLVDAATRKLVEETGARDVYLEQLYTINHHDDVTPGGAVAVTYFALVDHGSVRLADRTDWRPQWFSMAHLPNLAFRNEEVLRYALERLRNKMAYANVMYALLPKRFTLSRLQRAYESILGHALDKRNFRKRITSLEIIEPTTEHQADGAGRPARLYRFASRRPATF